MKETSSSTVSHRIRVRWPEVDQQGVVFNGHYLAYFDLAVTELMRARGLPYPGLTERFGVDIVMVRSEIDYRAPARFDDELDVSIALGRVGNKSITFEFAIERGGELLTEGRSVYVTVDGELRSVPVPPGLPAALG